MGKRIACVVVVLLVSMLLSTAVRAADKAPPNQDPVARAFALPPGLVLTPEEMAWANSVREELEPKLRDALRRVENGADKEERAKAAAEVREIKQQIQLAIDKILQDRAAKAAEEYRKKVAEAKKKQAEAAKKRAQNQKKRAKKRRKRK